METLLHITKEEARETNRKMQKGTPVTGRFLVTKTTVKLPPAT
jgi:hypothetical protein